MKLGWRGALGLAVSIALLVWALKGVSFDQVREALAQSNVWLIVLSGLIATCVFPLRALRWRVILEPVVDAPFGPLWRSTAVGMMVNNLAPGRLGEFARAYAVTKEVPKLSFATSFASLAVDRIIDAVIVVVLLALSVALGDIPSTTAVGTWTVREIMMTTGAIATVALAGVTAIAFFPALVTRIFDALFAKSAPKFHQFGQKLLGALVEGLGALRSPSRLVRILAWGFAMWLVNAFAFYVGFIGVGIDVPFSAAVFVQSLIAIGVAAPSSPGFVGVFELFAKLGLALYAIPGGLAVTWALAFHLASFIPITIIGLFYFGRLGLHFRDLGNSAQPVR